MIVFKRHPFTLVYLAAALVIGLLAFAVGQSAGERDSSGGMVIECGTFPLQLEQRSTGLIRLASGTESGARLDLDFLDLDATILRTRHLDLVPNATATMNLPAGQMGVALQVIASAPVLVEVDLVPEGAGPDNHRAVPCKEIDRPVRGGGP